MADNRGSKPVTHTRKHLARLERERRQTRLILFIFIGILVAAAGLLFYGYLDVKYFQLQKPVAKVGEVEISSGEFQTRAKIQREGLLNTYQQYYLYQQYGIDMSAQLQSIQSQLDSTQLLGQNVIDAMVDEELIRQESAKRGITVTEDELEETIRSAENYYPDGTPTPAATPTEFSVPTESASILEYITATSQFTSTPEEAATFTPAPVTETVTTPSTADLSGTPAPTSTATASATPEPTATATATLIPTATLSGSPTPEPTGTPYTLEGFQQVYADKLTHYAKYGLTEAQYRELFRTDLLRQKLYEQVTKDVPHVEEQIRARHILVASEVEAQSIVESLRNGADFGDLASKRSTDTGSGAQGGDLGWFGKGAMVAPFEEAAFALKVGEISEPVQSDFGWHVIQVIGREERPLDASAYQTATDAAFREFLTSLRETYSVETYDLWMSIVPTVPSFESLATEAALTSRP